MAHNPWRRIGLGAVVWALLGALVLAASARADEGPVAAASEAIPPTAETVLSVPPPVPAPADPETVLSVPAPEAAPAPSPAPARETTGAPEPEQKAPVPEGVSSPAPPEVQPTPAPAPVAETIVVVPAPEKVTPAQEKAPEGLLSGSAPEKGQESVLAGASSGASSGSPSVAAVGVLPETPGGPPLGPSAPPEVPSTAKASPPSVGAGVVTSTAQRVRQFDCALSAVGYGAAQACGSEALSTQRFLSAPSMGLATSAYVAAVAAAGGSASGGGHGGSGAGSPPVGPAPSPPSAPSGASGSAAGSSGLGLSGFLTLAGLLLLGAPRAMRRLRLSCQPWRTACFVLIPERPG